MPPRVNEYMNNPVVTVMPSDTLAHARNLFLRHGISRLVVVENGNVVGIITATDLLRIFNYPELSRKAFDELIVRDVMTKDVIVIGETKSIVDAARIMAKKLIGSLPVVDSDGSLVGIITRTDLVRAYAEKYEGQKKVGEVMDTDPPTVSPYHSLYHVVEMMESRTYYKVIVVDGGKPVGVIAKRDIIFIDPRTLYSKVKYVKRDILLPKGRTGGLRFYYIPLASDVMTSSPKVIGEENDLAEAAEVMIKEKIGGLPVVDEEGKLKGFVSKYEIVNVLAGYT